MFGLTTEPLSVRHDLKHKTFNVLCIVATICTCQEICCVPYANFHFEPFALAILYLIRDITLTFCLFGLVNLVQKNLLQDFSLPTVIQQHFFGICQVTFFYFLYYLNA